MKKDIKKTKSTFENFSQDSLKSSEMKQISGGANLVEYILLVGVVALV